MLQGPLVCPMVEQRMGVSHWGQLAKVLGFSDEVNVGP